MGLTQSAPDFVRRRKVQWRDSPSVKGAVAGPRHRDCVNPRWEKDHVQALSSLSRCPLAHGSVGVYPYPGYTQGRHPEICKHGCTPGKEVGSKESPRATLIREAWEFQELYHREMGSTAAKKVRRIAEVMRSIQEKGTYELTIDELRHGARVAWRNAPKCSNRGHWKELEVLDFRDAETNEQMFKGCLELLERALTSRATTPFIALFRPAAPGSKLGPRVWNSQLHRFCAYRNDGVSITGDPVELEFTEFLEEELSWRPPEKRTDFDLLPLVLQIDPSKPPQVFDIPPTYVELVHLRHPEFAWFAGLGLKWYGIPFVSNIELTVGGITFTAAPFNGWYADTEVVRDLADEDRYSKLPLIAEKMGLDVGTNSSMWRDGAMYELCRGVSYSFGLVGMGMVDHHTLTQNFFEWYEEEVANRGYAPGNWKWIIPPMSASTSPCFQGLNKMTEYTLKPAYIRAPGWQKYWEWLGKPSHQTKRNVVNLISNWAVMKMLGWVMARVKARRPALAIFYASVSGNTKNYAMRMSHMLENLVIVDIIDLVRFPPKNLHSFGPHAYTQVWAVLTSTCGSGAPPAAARKFLSWLSDPGSHRVIKQKPFSVLGFGQSTYPRYCGAAELVQSLMLACGGTSIVPLAKADAANGEEETFLQWVKDIVLWLMSNTEISHDAVREHLPYVVTDDKSSKLLDLPFHTVKMSSRRRLTVDEKRMTGIVVERTPLFGRNDPKRSMCIVKLDISHHPYLTYTPGDYIQIYPKVTMTPQIESFAKHLGIEDLQGIFDIESLDGSPLSFPVPTFYSTALTEYLDVSAKLTLANIKSLLGYSLLEYRLGEADLTSFQDLMKDPEKTKDWLSKNSIRWLDIFDVFPSLSKQLPIELYFSLIPAMRPRNYSIASSHRFLEGRQVHCIVSRLRYTLPNHSERAGVCSNYICDMNVGDRVAFKFSAVPHFRLPINLEAPIVMIGAGTGVAPFKGFIQERVVLKRYGALGPAMMIYGCRNKDELAFEEELKAALADGLMTDFFVAYSREIGLPKMYVQDIMVTCRERLKEYVENPLCHVYVCGNVNVALGVARAFQDLIGEDALAELVHQGRLHEDVFGVGSHDRK